jgi:hypothetical protein
MNGQNLNRTNSKWLCYLDGNLSHDELVNLSKRRVFVSYTTNYFGLMDEWKSHDEAHGLARSPQTHPVSIIAGTSQFILDFCLPPDRAEETRVALEDVCEKRWLPRYGHRGATIISRVHVASTIIAHHSSWITKLCGVILGMVGLKELSRRLWGG